ncbi:hypothetical protein ACFY2M_44835 [Streptomyces sp. NPDC001276]|uniref:hypothetical protein n=1 Tax=Streptomyces sp. NPDC001276 TaxID=3364555 RepID=UPI0036CC0A73
MRELVGEDDHDEADDALHQTGGGGHAPVAVDDAMEVDVGVEDFGGVPAEVVALEEDLLEADRQDVAEAQAEQRDHHGSDAG